jgi:hypothetical protein
MALISKADIAARISVAELDRYSRKSDEAIDRAIREAEAAARSAALNVWTAESWDALTAEQLPDDARAHIVSDAIDRLSATFERSDDIATRAQDAARWRGRVVADKERSFDAILERRRSPMSFRSQGRIFGSGDHKSRDQDI